MVVCCWMNAVTLQVIHSLRLSLSGKIRHFQVGSFRPLCPMVVAAAKSHGCGDSRHWSLLASCDFEGNPLKIASDCYYFLGRRSKQPCDFCSGMVASPLVATMVTVILRREFCAAKFQALSDRINAIIWHNLFWAQEPIKKLTAFCASFFRSLSPSLFPSFSKPSPSCWDRKKTLCFLEETQPSGAELRRGVSRTPTDSLQNGHFVNTFGTKITADPAKCFQDLTSEKLLFLLRDRPIWHELSFPVILRLCPSCRTNYWNESESY